MRLFVFLLLALAVNTNSAAPLDGWTWRNPTPVGVFVHKVVFADGKFVFAGAAGYVGVSTNGRDWQLKSNPSVSLLSEAFHANGRWFVSGPIIPGVHGAKLLASDDGLNYEPVASFWAHALAYGNGRYLASDGGTLYTSIDGNDWTLLRSNSPPAAIVYGSSPFFVGLTGSGALSTSEDGVEWTTRHIASGVEFLRYDNGYYFAFGDGILLRSTNGIQWERIDAQTPEWVFSAIFTDKAWIIYGQKNDLTQQMSISTNKTDWTTTESKLGWRLFNVAYGNGIFVGMGEEVAISTNGVDWESISKRVRTSGGLAYGNGVFVATAGGTSLAAMNYSTNGLDWQTIQTGATGTVWHVVHGTNGFIAGGYLGTIIHSTDGKEWNQISVPELSSDTTSIYGLTYTDGKYIAVARTKLAFSTNAIDWEVVALPGVFYSIARAGDTYAIGGPYAGIWLSKDLRNWQRAWGADMVFGVSAAKGRFYQPLRGGYRISEDGRTWRDQRGPEIYSVREVNGGILAVGSPEGEINPNNPLEPTLLPTTFYYSNDGENWSNLGNIGYLSVSDFNYDSGRLFFVIANSSAIIEAPFFELLDLTASPSGTLTIKKGAAPGRLEFSDDLRTWRSHPELNLTPSEPRRFFRSITREAE